MGFKIELVGLCGAGKSTFIAGLEDRLTPDEVIELNHPVIPNLFFSTIYVLKILLFAFVAEPIACSKFLSKRSNWWLVKKLAYRQAGMRLRGNKNYILVDSGTLQPFLSFEIEEKVTTSNVPIEPLLCGCKLPDIVLFFHVSPFLARNRYEMRGKRGQGRVARKNCDHYFERAEKVRKSLFEYCRRMEIKTIEVDTTQDFTGQDIASTLVEIKQTLSNLEGKI